MTPKRLAPLVRRPHRSYGLIRLLQTVRHRLRLSPLPMRPRLRLAGQFEDLPGSRHKACGRAGVLGHRGGRRHPTKAMPAMLPSADVKASAPRTNVFSVLNTPAHPYRYRRFAYPLTGAGVQLAEKPGSVRPSFRGLSPPDLCQFVWHTESVHLRTPQRARLARAPYSQAAGHRSVKSGSRWRARRTGRCGGFP